MITHSSTDLSEGTHVLLDTTGEINGPRMFGYDHHWVSVPPGAVELVAYLRYEGQALFLSLYDPIGYRGTVMNPRATSSVVLEARCSEQHASPGVIAGSLASGDWRITVDHGPDLRSAEYRLTAFVRVRQKSEKEDMPGSRRRLAVPDDGHSISKEAGWFCGELHAHTMESDGERSAAEVARAAEAAALDFISITDHCTVSGWHHAREAMSRETVLIRGCEVSSRHGHANYHGVSTPIDPCVDGDGWTIADLADEVHRQGGIFGVNHPFSARLGWRFEGFDWSRADVIEIIHGLDGPGNNLQLPLWDRLLALGHRIVGVAGTDSHDPTEGAHAIGRLVNWIWADQRSEAGIVEGIRRGQVVASRGPLVQFSAECGGSRFRMWEEIPADLWRESPVTLRIRIRKLHEPIRVFVLRDGFTIDYRWLNRNDRGGADLDLDLNPSAPCYYRIELHADFAPYLERDTTKSNGWRDYRTLVAATNPIGLGP